MAYDILKIDRNTRAPIREYRDLLNWCSSNYGTPISVNVMKELKIIEEMKDAYAVAIYKITNAISEGKSPLAPQDRKYNMMEFQRDYFKVPVEVVSLKGSVSASDEVRRRIDKECPNFFNSMFIQWSDLNSRSRVKNIANAMEEVEGQKDALGNPLFVVRPTYNLKEDTTYRITTEEPNTQGLSTLYKKEFLLPEEGRVMVGADISSQEPNIFFNGMCRYEELLKGYREHGEYYRPLVATIEGVPIEKVDPDLRKAYKVGILAKMNNGGLGLLTEKMGSPELAEKLNAFINSNEKYKMFKTRVNRQMMTSQPSMGGFIEGWERVITRKSRGSLNQLMNAPLQITAISFFSISIFSFYERLMKEVGKWKTLEEVLKDVRPIYHAHDEVVFSVVNEGGLPEKVKEILKWALSIQYEDWTPMQTEPYIGVRYEH